MQARLVLVWCVTASVFVLGCSGKPQGGDKPGPAEKAAGAKAPQTTADAKGAQKPVEPARPVEEMPAGPTSVAELPGIAESETAIAPVLAASAWRAHSDSMKWIGLAMHNYADSHRRLPAAAICDAEGKPLLSWRVAILQYLEGDECQALYRQFKLDEPWDSEHNRKLVEKMPQRYAVPGRENDGKTTLMLLIGKGIPFAGKEGPRLDDFTDGLANTLMVVDAGADKAVPWSKPEDLPFSPDGGVAALGDVPEDGFLCLLADGRVRRLPKAIKPDLLAAMATHNGGESVDIESPEVGALKKLYTEAKPVEASRAENAALAEWPERAFLCDGMVAAVVTRPRATLTIPPLMFSPPGQLLERVDSQMGLALREVQRLTLLLEAPAEGKDAAADRPAILLQLAHPFTAKDLAGLDWGCLEEMQIAGHPCYGIGGGAWDGLTVYFPDTRTAVCAPQPLLERMLAGGKSPAPLAEPLARLDAEANLGLAVALGPKAGQADRLTAWLARPVGEAAGALVQGMPAAEWIAASLDLVGETTARVEIRAKDETAADQVEKFVAQKLADAKTGFEAVRAWCDEEMPAEVKEVALQFGEEALAAVTVEKQGQTVTVALPKVAARDRVLLRANAVLNFAREAFERAQPTYMPKLIGLAMHNYHDSYRHFPAAALCDKEGKPLLSWRVAILPYIEEEALYDEFHLDEPWDSEHNRKLLPRMPKLYATAGPREQGKTSLVVLVGGGALFEEGKSPRYHGHAWSTIMAVVADPDKAVPWTKPEDLPFDPNHPLASVGNIPASGMPVVFVPGVTAVIPPDVSPEIFKALVTGEPEVDTKTFQLKSKGEE